jgi:hypothetical protein
VHTQSESESLKEKGNMADLDVDWRVILKGILNIQDVKVCSGFIWFRMGPTGALVNAVMKLHFPVVPN